jgi:hypothetical protein
MENHSATMFTTAFNPMIKDHVMWLGKMNRMMETLDPTKQMDLDDLVNTNPMGVKMKNALDWVFIHFSIAMKYTKAILECKAWVPTK